MALRNQPYIPLYVQDVLTDEKLIECSMESHGLYFRLICILHKQDIYGKLCLKQKHKQSTNKYENFALMLAKQTPFEAKQIASALMELDEERVIKITDDYIEQKRMVKDGEISLIRTTVGKMGGSNVTKQYGKNGFIYLMSNYYDLHKIGISVNPQNRLYRIRCDNQLKKFDIIDKIQIHDMGKAEDLAFLHFNKIRDGEWIRTDYENVIKEFDLFKAKIKANSEANSEYEYEDEIDNEDKINKKEQNFKNDVLQFKQYPESMLNEFITYWTEPNKSKTKFRYELEKTWDTARRLNTWAGRSKDFKKPEIKQKPVYKSSNFEDIVKDDNITPVEMPDSLKRLSQLAQHKTINHV